MRSPDDPDPCCEHYFIGLNFSKAPAAPAPGSAVAPGEPARRQVDFSHAVQHFKKILQKFDNVGLGCWRLCRRCVW